MEVLQLLHLDVVVVSFDVNDRYLSLFSTLYFSLLERILRLLMACPFKKVYILSVVSFNF